MYAAFVKYIYIKIRLMLLVYAVLFVHIPATHLKIVFAYYRFNNQRLHGFGKINNVLEICRRTNTNLLIIAILVI